MFSSRLLIFSNRKGNVDSFAQNPTSPRDTLVEVWARTKRTPWFVPREEKYPLVFFQRIYARLLEQRRNADIDGADPGVPLRDMQRCLGRIFRLAAAEQGFDARRYASRGDGTVGWWEFCVAWKEEKLSLRYSLAERIFLTLEDPQSSRVSRICSIIVLLAILASAGSFIISTLPDMQAQPCPRCEPEAHPAFEWIDTVCVVLFTVEYLLRLVTATVMRTELINQDELVRNACSEELMSTPSKLMRTWMFIRSGPSLIDLAAILPTYVAWTFPKRQPGDTGGGDSTLVLLKLTRLMRVVRAFRLGRRFEAVVIIAKAMHRSLRILWVLVLNLGLNMVVFGAIIYLFEQGDYDVETGLHLRPGSWVLANTTGTLAYERELGSSPFESIPHSFWWSLVTATTVGYGDMYPTTDLGKVTAGMAAVWSLCVLALPVGVIGCNFQRVWEEFDQEKQKERQLMLSAEDMEKQTRGAIDPLSNSRKLLFEVFHDSGMHTTANDIFLGEAEVELPLEKGSCEPASRRLRLLLQESRAKSRRKVSGELHVKYTWHPAVSPSQAGMELEGTLTVTVFGARGLVAVDWKGSGLSDPYVVVTVYPTSPPEDGRTLEPQVVQTKTIFDDPAPFWNETTDFIFSWHRNAVKALREHERKLSLEKAPPRAAPSPVPVEPPELPAQPRAAEVQRLLRSLPRLRGEVQRLHAGLPELRGEIRRLRESAAEMLALLGQVSSSCAVPGSVPGGDPAAAARGGAAG